jgi:hypothetical protein
MEGLRENIWYFYKYRILVVSCVLFPDACVSISTIYVQINFTLIVHYMFPPFGRHQMCTVTFASTVHPSDRHFRNCAGDNKHNLVVSFSKIMELSDD